MSRNYGNVKPWVKAAGEEIANRFNVTNLTGWYFSTWGEHPKGLAIDFMVNSKSQGDQIAQYGQANAGRLSIQYIIWYRHIWNIDRNDEGWRIYVGTPNPHTDHVHISFTATPNGNGGPVVDPAGNIIPNPLQVPKELGHIAEWVMNPENWIRIVMGIAGAVLVLFALIRIGRNAI